eukprot:3189201-Amphidinium_carterae.1
MLLESQFRVCAAIRARRNDVLWDTLRMSCMITSQSKSRLVSKAAQDALKKPSESAVAKCLENFPDVRITYLSVLSSGCNGTLFLIVVAPRLGDAERNVHITRTDHRVVPASMHLT